MTGGVKYDGGKARFDLLPPASLVDIAQVFTMGAAKYADRNWELGIKWGRVYGALQRHLHAYWGGEETDPESGLPHLAHAGFGILVLLEFIRTHPELDDRGGKAGNDVPAQRAPTPADKPASGKDEQSIPQGDGGRVVLGEAGGLVDRVQVRFAAPETYNAHPYRSQPPAASLDGF